MENHLKVPSSLTARDVTDQSFTAHWTNNDDRTESYSLRLTHMMREQEQKRAVDEGFDLMANGSKEQPDATDCSGSLDDYMVSKGWTGEQIFMAGGAMMLGKVGIDGWLKSPKLNFASFDRDFAVLLKVKLGRITSSPGLRSQSTAAISSAEVPLVVRSTFSALKRSSIHAWHLREKGPSPQIL